MRNRAKHRLSPALSGTLLSPGPHSEGSPACPPGVAPLPVSSLYSPSGHSTHSKQQVGSPSMIPFLVPARQSRLQLEKGTWGRRSQQRGAAAVGSVFQLLWQRVRGRSWALAPVWQAQAQSRRRKGQRPVFLLSLKGTNAYGKVHAHTHTQANTSQWNSRKINCCESTQ